MQEKQMHLVFEEDLKRLKRYFAGSGKDIEFINLWSDNLRLGTYEENPSQDATETLTAVSTLADRGTRDYWSHPCKTWNNNNVCLFYGDKCTCGAEGPGPTNKSDASTKDEDLVVGAPPRPGMWSHVCLKKGKRRIWSHKSTEVCAYGCGTPNPFRDETSKKSLEWLQKLISADLVEWDEKAECYIMTSPSNEIVWINRDGMITDVEYR